MSAGVLSKVSLGGPEDTRVTRRLLSHLESIPASPAFINTTGKASWKGIGEFARDVALVTDAGMPGIRIQG
ncbi:MAG: hypothetical protein Ct9H300mP11_16760 [Chloroflexota bacterium]|nr:MAG: hypothetical protein Ct9H300mP11_16760 [Chloroflexota bacterium]